MARKARNTTQKSDVGGVFSWDTKRNFAIQTNQSKGGK